MITALPRIRPAFLMSKSPSIVAVASTMRSGSTLLKALLAEADDVLNLPETNFQNLKVVERILTQHQGDDPPIKVLKKPAWYQESKRYPKLPTIEGVRTVALVRDVYDTVVSLRKMTFRGLAGISAPLVTGWLAKVYWFNVTQNLTSLAHSRPNDVKLVRYEDLIADPIAVTTELYEFIGSSKTEGTKSYSAPTNYAWRWGSDDGSPNIKTLEVQPPREKERAESRLLQIMENCERVKALRSELGYQD